MCFAGILGSCLMHNNCICYVYLISITAMSIKEQLVMSYQKNRLIRFSFKFQVGLLYDEVSLQNVLDLTADWTEEERQMLRNKVM